MNGYQQIVARIVQEIHPDKIILFGSQARGQAKPDSDIDLLVIAESKEPRFRRSARLYGVLSRFVEPMDIIVYTPAEIEEWSAVPQAFITTVIREGKILYEKPNGPGQKLAA